MAKNAEKGKSSKDQKAVEQSTEQTEDTTAAKDESFALSGGMYAYGAFGSHHKEPVPPIEAKDLDARLSSVMKAVEELRDGVTPRNWWHGSKDTEKTNQLAQYSGQQINDLVRFNDSFGISYHVSSYLNSLPISAQNKAHELNSDYYGYSTCPQKAITDLQKVVSQGSKFWKMLDEVDESDIRLEKINKILIGNFLGVQEFEQYDNACDPPWETSEITDPAFDDFCNSLVRLSTLVTAFYSTHRHHMNHTINYAVPVSAAVVVKNPFFVIACANTQTDMLRRFAASFNAVARSKSEEGKNFNQNYNNSLIGKEFEKLAVDEIIWADSLQSSHSHRGSFHDVIRAISELRTVIIREISKGKRVYGIIGMLIENITTAVAGVAFDVLSKFNLWVRAYDRAGLNVTDAIKLCITEQANTYIENSVGRTARDYDCPF